MEFIAYLVLGICFILLLYFGYRDDFRRDQKKFINTVLSILIIGSIHVILTQIELEVPLWISLSFLIFFVLMNLLFPNSNTVENENNTMTLNC